MTLEDLVGQHVLSGVDRLDDAAKDQNVCIFVLDGVAYVAEEDPDDGYRSYMRELRVSEEPVKNTFSGVKVVGVMRAPGSENSDVLELRDVVTGELVLAVGTDGCDDYYPYCVIEYHPEAMSLNYPQVKP